ncbi:Ejaculatory bulb-specific protein 3 [Trachymyrmex septentrionalis]|uniref:Ejaculatory bulb-specific protein 3 n=1 Tax=Trachymyrmex septentrionalis TaxID=34720 RepID=A0A195F4E3_9HYME|nr:PREDICTED: ejaculatory bulb-specific protein 3-like [Trachymyrmex septentrionalis]KYN34954.1 Ejaculatory bulb-specific protein 3 [Trachymyrmex septentrionalis]
MSQLSRIVLIIAMYVVMCVLAEEERYSDQYDHVDIQAIIQNKELRKEYYNCFMEIAPCKSPEQQNLTDMFSEAFQTKCRKCTKKQIENLDMVTNWFVTNEPETWKLIVAKTVEKMKKKAASNTDG